MFGYDLGMDLGSSSIVIEVPGKGIVVNEPSYIAFEKETGKILCAGKKAYYLEGREPEGVEVIQPIVGGAITDYAMAQQMLHYFINKVIKRSMFRPRVVTTVSALNTDVERRTLISVIISAGARSVCLLEEPLAAAYGAGLDPQSPTGAFIIDIGAVTTDMAIVSGGSLNQIETSKIAGNRFDEEITRYLANEYGLLVGKRTAEDVKQNIGSAVERENDVVMNVRGRDKVTALPKTVEVSANELWEASKELYNELAALAVTLFERTTAQLVTDISSGEVILTGGCANIYGMDKLFANALSLDVTTTPHSELCVARGTMAALNKMHVLDEQGYRFLTKEDVRTS